MIGEVDDVAAADADVAAGEGERGEGAEEEGEGEPEEEGFEGFGLEDEESEGEEEGRECNGDEEEWLGGFVVVRLWLRGRCGCGCTRLKQEPWPCVFVQELHSLLTVTLSCDR